MTIAVQDFDVVAGDTIEAQVTISYQDGSALPLQDCQEILWLAAETQGGDAIIQKTFSSTPPGIAFLTNGSDGIILVRLAPTDTSNLAGYYFHKVKITDSGGARITVTLGTMHVLRNLGGV